MSRNIFHNLVAVCLGKEVWWLLQTIKLGCVYMFLSLFHTTHSIQLKLQNIPRCPGWSITRWGGICFITIWMLANYNVVATGVADLIEADTKVSFHRNKIHVSLFRGRVSILCSMCKHGVMVFL